MKEYNYLIGDVYTGIMIRIEEFGSLMGLRMWKASTFNEKKRIWVEVCSRSAPVPSDDAGAYERGNFLHDARKAYAEEVAADMPRLRAEYPWMY